MTAGEVLDVVLEELAHVLALDSPPDPDAAFAIDLGADSLDLVETVERVERRLAAAGFHVRVPEDELAALTTPRSAAHALVAHRGAAR